MDVNTFIQIVNGIGFPIAACIGLAVFIVWDKKTRREDNKEFQAHQEQLYKEMRDSLDNNTKAINNLVSRLERGEKDV